MKRINNHWDIFIIFRICLKVKRSGKFITFFTFFKYLIHLLNLTDFKYVTNFFYFNINSNEQS